MFICGITTIGSAMVDEDEGLTDGGLFFSSSSKTLGLGGVGHCQLESR